MTFENYWLNFCRISSEIITKLKNNFSSWKCWIKNSIYYNLKLKLNLLRIITDSENNF